MHGAQQQQQQQEAGTCIAVVGALTCGLMPWLEPSGEHHCTRAPTLASVGAFSVTDSIPVVFPHPATLHAVVNVHLAGAGLHDDIVTAGGATAGGMWVRDGCSLFDEWS